MSMKMVLVSLDQQNNHGIMDEENQDSLCSSDFSEGGDFSNFTSSEGEDGNFSESSDPTSPSSSSSRNEHKIGALQNMSSLLQELPFKRGLSKHYNGKSQSFTSLSNVISLEDMAKPENPYNKRLKSCKSYGVFLEGFKSDHAVIKSSSFSRHNSKKTCSSLRARRNGSFKKRQPDVLSSLYARDSGKGGTKNESFLGNNNSRPPVPPHRSTSTASFTSQTPLFA